MIKKTVKFKPILPIIFVSGSSFESLNVDEISGESVGGKAYGLSCIPAAWTLPFVVVSETLFAQWKNTDTPIRLQLIQSWKSTIINACVFAGIPNSTDIIVRSSGISENLLNRGEYFSEFGQINALEIIIEKCFNFFLLDPELNNKRICLIVQKYIPVRSDFGHLSNERRCFEEARDWHVEYTQSKSSNNINIRNWRKKISLHNLTELPLQCNRFDNIIATLKLPSAFAHQRDARVHFEWVWDGQCIYIVQADIEQQYVGVDPRKFVNPISSNFLDFSPKFLKPISNDLSETYSKINNIFVYRSLGLPITKFYILHDQSVLHSIACDEIPSALISDLLILVQESLVIRMDINSNNLEIRQMLPRTNEVRDVNEAIAWLRTQCQNIELIKHQPAFIFHNFVPAHASAFVYASPKQRKVIVDALWGLPEGLYYNSFDSYVVDTGHRDLEKVQLDDYGNFKYVLSKKYKHYFVAPDQNGKWDTRILIQPFDWKPTIEDDKLIFTIAHQSRLIAEKEQHPISIMWLIDVDTSISPTRVLPWYHEHYDIEKIKQKSQFRKKTLFDKEFVVKTSEDIIKLEREADKPSSMIRCIRIEPHDDELLRDKHTLKKIGNLAIKLDATIFLEGSTLSHAYYQLIQTTARVETVPFAISHGKIEYYKLVRDLVPAKIIAGGETVLKTSFSGNNLLRLLKDKLVEECLEVLDAEDREQILDELADVNEIVDSILSNIHSNRHELSVRQKKKSEKAGRFDDGFVLLETDNPLLNENGVFPDRPLLPTETPPPTTISKRIDFSEVFEKSRAISKWSDNRLVQPEAESILSLEVPILNDNWTATSPEYNSNVNSGYTVRASISCKRFGSKLNLRLSIVHFPKQLKFL